MSDGDMHLGNFHLAMAQQLMLAASLDVASTYRVGGSSLEEKKRLYWSLQLLEQRYGSQGRPLPIISEYFRASIDGESSCSHDPPPLPSDWLHDTGFDCPGIWIYCVQIGYIWNQLRTYVTECSTQKMATPPWLNNSAYAIMNSRLIELENQVPIQHRYDTVRFYDQDAEILKKHSDYWHPWLRLQFTYHAIHAALNHPFVHVWVSRNSPGLASPNTFWKRCSELGLLHATWLVRLIDMATEKQFPLADPIFAHAAAISATIHIFYTCTNDLKLKLKSNTDLWKCRRFLQSFLSFSDVCKSLVSLYFSSCSSVVTTNLTG